jgi:DNA-binding transcriptional MerR regulator
MAGIGINAVAKLAGISQATLRSWERRYDAVSPKRTSTGRRSYREQDIDRLRMLANLVRSGHSIGEIAKLSLANLRKLDPVPTIATPPSSPDIAPRLTALLPPHEDLDLLSSAILAEAKRLAPREFVFRVAVPLMREVGCRVEAGAMSIFQEHGISMVVRDMLARHYRALRDRSIRQGRSRRHPPLLFTTSSGNIHEIGILAAAVLSEAAGVGTCYLGPNLSAFETAQAALASRSEKIVISYLPKSSRHSPNLPAVSVQEYSRELLRLLPKSHELWVGGEAYPTFSHPRAQPIATLEEFEKRILAHKISLRKEPSC